MKKMEFPSIKLSGKLVKIALALLFVLFVTVLIKTAWISDDSYITLRTVDNFVNGHGLRWNVGERVQTYTHPLWMFLLTVFYFFTREAYFTTIILSVIISITAFYILTYKTSFSVPGAFLGALALIMSKAFTDYSTSGLENALSHLILAFFVYGFFKYEPGYFNLGALSAIACLGSLNRLDHILIFAPALLYASWRTLKMEGGKRAKRRVILALAVGFLPLMLWEIFSTVYYGFPFPNTAYAKLNTGISRIELIEQGFLYFRDSYAIDPITLTVILISVVLAFTAINIRLRCVSAGIFLYLVYIPLIGGDFMSGRFFSAPLFCSAAILAAYEYNKSRIIGGLLIILMLGLLIEHNPVRSGADYLNRDIDNKIGIADERGFYYPRTGLLVSDRGKRLQEYSWVREMQIARRSTFLGERIVAKANNAGFSGYFAGPDVHIVDQCALCDAFLAMFSANGRFTGVWRIGHYTRSIPKGYMETLKTGKNVIQNPDYSEFYDRLSVVIKSRIFSFRRFVQIWNINTGKYDYLLSKKILSLDSFKSQTAERIEDISSCNGLVLRALPGVHSSGLLACGPALRLSRGKYSAGFWFKANKVLQENVARLDITSDKGKRVLASMDLTGVLLGSNAEWKLIELPFKIEKKQARDVEFRVYYSGGSALSFDYAMLKYDL